LSLPHYVQRSSAFESSFRRVERAKALTCLPPFVTTREEENAECGQQSCRFCYGAETLGADEITALEILRFRIHFMPPLCRATVVTR